MYTNKSSHANRRVAQKVVVAKRAVTEEALVALCCLQTYAHSLAKATSDSIAHTPKKCVAIYRTQSQVLDLIKIIRIDISLPAGWFLGFILISLLGL